MALRINKIRGSIINSQLAIVEPTDDGLLENLARKSIRDGEERLMLAVLESATKDFQKYINARDKKAKLLFSQAEEWFLTKDSDSLFSFENICEVLRLQPNYLRKGLLRWKEAHHTRARKAERNTAWLDVYGMTGPYIATAFASRVKPVMRGRANICFNYPSFLALSTH